MLLEEVHNHLRGFQRVNVSAVVEDGHHRSAPLRCKKRAVLAAGRAATQRTVRVPRRFDGGLLIGELNLMVKSIRELAEDFDKRSGALIADGRRTLSDISRAVNNFDRNPTRVIFGGSNNAAPAAEAAKPAAAANAARPAPSGQKRQ